MISTGWKYPYLSGPKESFTPFLRIPFMIVPLKITLSKCFSFQIFPLMKNSVQLLGFSSKDGWTTGKRDRNCYSCFKFSPLTLDTRNTGVMSSLSSVLENSWLSSAVLAKIRIFPGKNYFIFILMLSINVLIS